MIFYNNGLVIQDKNKDTRYFTIPPTYFRGLDTSNSEFLIFRSYNGIGRYLSWPLSLEKDATSKALSSEAPLKSFGFIELENLENPEEPIYPLEVLTDRNCCVRYIAHCKEKNINTRVLLCSTPRQSKLWDSDIPDSIFLGYDYAYANDDFYSAIPIELLLEPAFKYIKVQEYKELLDCKKLLNKNQLFQTQEGILTFIEAWKNIIAASKTNPKRVPKNLIDSSGDFVIYCLSEVKGNL